MWGRGGFAHGLGQFGGPLGPASRPPRPPRLRARASNSGGGEAEIVKPGQKWQFPVKAALTSGGLSLVGDTVAQFYTRYEAANRASLEFSSRMKKPGGDSADYGSVLRDHDWMRSLRMGSYGFFLYGPISHWWYELLDLRMPAKNLPNFSAKVVLNQIVLGPIIVSLVFAWNLAWQGRLESLPELYRNRAVSTLVDGWKFWTPVSFLNFGLVPLRARVGFMSTCAICWNFYLSSVVSPKS